MPIVLFQTTALTTAPSSFQVMGSDEEKVSSCIQHLVSMSEDYMDEADDWMEDYIKNPTKDSSQQVRDLL